MNALAPNHIPRRDPPGLSHIKVTSNLNIADAEFLCKPVDVGEIEEAIKSVNPQKSQGPEGFQCWFIQDLLAYHFGSEFLQEWEIVELV